MLKNVWVIIETVEKRLHPVTLELMEEGGRLASELGEKCYAVIFGEVEENTAKELYIYGANEVICLKHPLLIEYQLEYVEEAAVKLFESVRPAIVLAGATITGREYIPRIAARLHGSLLKDCTDIRLDKTDRRLTGCGSLGCSQESRYKLKGEGIQFAAHWQGTGIPAVPKVELESQVPKIIIPDLSAVAPSLRRIKKKQYHTAKRLEDAKLIAAGGRGVGEEGVRMLSAFAEHLGGMTACTRPIADAGWADFTQQIGQTGVTVRPDVYLAFGISGAVQHVAGMKESSCIIGINTDPGAEIFRYCDYGIKADAKRLLAALLERLERHGT